MQALLKSFPGREAVIGAALLAVLAASATYSYLLFHTFAELFSVVIAFGVFMLAWNTRRFLNNDYLLFIGLAYLFVAFLDILHTLAYRGMPVFPGFDDNNLPPQIWLVARSLESLALLGAPAFFHRRLRVPVVVLGFCAATGLALASIFHWRNFPVCFVEGAGLTPFKIVAEYVVCAVLAAAAWLLWRHRERFDPSVLRLLFLSLAATMATELCFTAYTDLYAGINLAGHLFKILSFYFMYRAIIATGLERPYDLLFRDLQQEIEERRRAETRLRQSRELLDKTQKAGGVGGFEWDFGQDVVELTETACLLLEAPRGFRPSGDDFFGRAAPDDRLSLMEAFDRARSQGALLDVEARLSTLAGDERWFRFLGGLATRDARTTLAGSLQDVSDRKRLELLREDIDRIARHDLKSPLNAVIGLPEVILSDPDMPREERAGYLRLIQQTGYKMLDLINISLDMFKMEQGTYRPEPVPVDLVRLMRRLAEESADRIQGRKLRLEVRVGGLPPDRDSRFPVLGEELLCWSMLGNLLANAIEASPAGAAVEVAMDAAHGRGVVSIRNQGAVPGDVRERFFEKYATSGKRGGTGLGTYSARLIARTLGGDVVLDASAPGATTVSVSLPLA